MKRNDEGYENIFTAGQKAGLGEMEIYHVKSSGFGIRVFKGEIDDYSVSASEGISLRGEYGGQTGYAYTSKIDREAAAFLADHAKQNAQVLTNEESDRIHAPSASYKHKDTYEPALDRVTEKEKIDFAIALEKSALDYDPRIVAADYCKVADSSMEMKMINTKGLDLWQRGNIAYCYINVVAQENDSRKTGLSYRISTDFYSFDPKRMACEACERALALLGATSIKSGNYSVVLEREAVIDFFGAFCDIFSAESVQKGLSLLKGQLQKNVAAPCVTVVDNPFVPLGMGYRSFDDEGTAGIRKNVIDKGVLTTYLHNHKTAKKDGVETTANAYRGSYQSSISIAPTNFYIEKGESEFDDLLDKAQNGLLITELEGLHSGLNTVSGDFSLSARGFIIKNGLKKDPVEQITVSGNIMPLLQNVVAVGNDFKFGMPSGGGYHGAPSLLIDGLSVAGE